MRARENYFADVHETFLCNFEQSVNVQFVASGRLMSGNFEEDFFCNGQADNFCLGKIPFAALNEKGKPRLFKQL